MTFTSNLLLALLFLAPGFGTFVGIYSGSQRPFTAAPPIPSTIHSLAVVTLGAMLSHAIVAWLVTGVEAYCGGGGYCATPSVDLNPYNAILALRSSAPHLQTAGIGWLFTVAILIILLGYALGFAAVTCIGRLGVLRGLLFGWIGDALEVASLPDSVITAHVITDIEKDGAFLGYEGMLLDLRQSSNGEVQTIILASADAHCLNLNPPDAQPKIVEERIPFVMLDKANIKSIAFHCYRDLRSTAEASPAA